MPLFALERNIFSKASAAVFYNSLLEMVNKEKQ